MSAIDPRSTAGARTGCARARVRALALALALAFAPTTARADVVTLSALERVALGDREALQADRAAAKAASADIDKAESAYMPVIALNAGVNMAPGRKLVEIDVDPSTDEDIYLLSGARTLEQDGAFDPQTRSEIELELKGNLYDFGRTRAAIEASRARGTAAAAERDVTTQAILDAVRTGYLGWLGSHELLAFASQGAGDATSRRTRVQALIAEGVRPAADLTPAQADEALATLELERARGNLRAARLALEQAVGTALPDGAEPDRGVLDRYAPLPPAATGAGATTAAEAATAIAAAGTRPNASTHGGAGASEDPAAAALALQASAARAGARAAERADAPVLSAALSAGVNVGFTTTREDDSKLSAFPGYAAGIGLTVPLWDGGSSHASAGAAYARAAELDARSRAQRALERDRRARAALDGENAVRLLRAASALQAVCEQRLREVEQAYELGAGGIDPIAQARGALRRAQSEVVLARLARVQAMLAVRGEP